MAENQFRNDLTQGSVTRSLVKFAIPFLLSNLLQAMYNVADMYVVGRFADAASISGVSIGGQFTMMVLNIVAGLSIGGQVLVAQYNGAKKYKDQQQTIGTMLSIYIIAAAILTIAMLLSSTWWLRIINTPVEAFAEAQSYMNICMSGTIFIFGYNAIASILRGLGDSKRPLVFVAIATVVNIVLDVIFVGPMGMGAAGAALATVIAQALSFIISIIYLKLNNFMFDFKPKSFKISWEKTKMLVKIGLPNSVQLTLVGLSFLTLTSLINSFGVAASAATGITSKVNSFAILPAIAMSSSISSMAGQNIGAKEYERAKQTMFVGMRIALGFGAVICIIVNLFPEAILGIFTDDAEVIQTGANYLRITSIEYFISPIMFCINGFANGSGYSTITMFNAIISSVALRVPLAYFFSNLLNMGLIGMALANATAPFGAIAFGTWFILSNKWRTPRIHIHDDYEAMAEQEVISEIGTEGMD